MHPSSVPSHIVDCRVSVSSESVLTVSDDFAAPLLFARSEGSSGSLLSYSSLDELLSNWMVLCSSFSHLVFLLLLVHELQTRFILRNPLNHIPTPRSEGETYLLFIPGTETMQRILALHTPLHEVTVGSGCKLSMHTCPTYPSLLHTQTSLPLSPSVGAAHVNCKPALVFLMGTVATSSGVGLLSPDIAGKNHVISIIQKRGML